MNRRNLILGSSAALAASSLYPKISRASISGADRKFIFVFCYGGWDPAMVFCPHLGDGDLIDRESNSDTATAGNIPYVSSSRSIVNNFFDTHYENILLFNGLEVRNIDHWICAILSKTGDTGGDLPDWATIIGQQQMENYIIPHFVMGGPVFAGEYPNAVVSSSGGNRLYHMLNGAFNFQYSGDIDLPATFAPDSRSALHAFAAQRQQALLSNTIGRRKTLLENSVDSLNTLQLSQPHADKLRGGSLDFDQATDLLSAGLVRCVSMNHNVSPTYDTHSANYYYQGNHLTALFDGLHELMAHLASKPGTVAPTLMEETTVVVHSEMGKTPQINGSSGKDHWPFTTTMLLGSGFTGNRVVGSFTGGMNGEKVDFATGDLFDGGSVMTASTIGATLLAMADIDPGDWALDSSPITGILT